MSLRSMTRRIVVWGLLLWTGSLSAADGTAPLVVHEWGTFTALQDEHGTGLVGINVDTEPVPQFVHNLGRFLLNDAVLSSEHWIHRQKSVPRHHPSVAMRPLFVVLEMHTSACLVTACLIRTESVATTFRCIATA